MLGYPPYMRNRDAELHLGDLWVLHVLCIDRVRLERTACNLLIPRISALAPQHTPPTILSRREQGLCPCQYCNAPDTTASVNIRLLARCIRVIPVHRHWFAPIASRPPSLDTSSISGSHRLTVTSPKCEHEEPMSCLSASRFPCSPRRAYFSPIRRRLSHL